MPSALVTLLSTCRLKATRFQACLLQSCLALALMGTCAASASAEGDVERGAHIFRICAACHSTKPAEHLTGPSLANVWGRKAGTAEGFQRYSEAMKRSGVTWHASTLRKWLTDPEIFIHGTSMSFPGLRNERDRDDVIAYLHAVSEERLLHPRLTRAA